MIEDGIGIEEIEIEAATEIVDMIAIENAFVMIAVVGTEDETGIEIVTGIMTVIVTVRGIGAVTETETGVAGIGTEIGMIVKKKLCLVLFSHRLTMVLLFECPLRKNDVVNNSNFILNLQT